MTTCIIQGANNFFSSSFIRAHIEYLAGEKVVLNNYYPQFSYKGREIRYFYGRRPLLKKLKKLMPHWFYHRHVTLWEETYAGRHDAISAFMKHHNVDVILAEFGTHGSNICPHARDLGIPLIVHFHGHDAQREPVLEDFRERYKVMFDYAFKLISVSNFMTETLVRMGADRDKIVCNPYGPREMFYRNQSDYQKTLLAIGRFTDIKAPYLTLMAFRQVLENHPDAKLVMGGHGELQEVCRTLAKTWDIESQVFFPGVLRHEEVLSLFSEACCFVQHSLTPSYGDAEGTPVAILEAGAAALPVISTRHAGIADAVIHGETGFLVEERDLDGMAHYMKMMLDDRDLCVKMGAAAREHIRANYNIERHIQCIDKLIDEARHLKRRDKDNVRP
jgi:colanic acid/amylovoran biosynthesis glycosyltransferase